MSPMTIIVDEIRAVENGAAAEISVEISAGTDIQRIKGRIAAEMLGELGLPAMIDQPIPISRERCDELMFCIQKTAAIQKGLSFLGYARQTKRSLRRKLIGKGFDRTVADAAVEYLVICGDIDEASDAQFLAETLAERRMYGASRIKKELYAKGFESGVIRETMNALDIDFEEICATRLRSMGGPALLEEKSSREKTIAALMRYGFSYEEIRHAVKILKND